MTALSFGPFLSMAAICLRYILTMDSAVSAPLRIFCCNASMVISARGKSLAPASPGRFGNKIEGTKWLAEMGSAIVPRAAARRK
jgi:hypothetical protein